MTRFRRTPDGRIFDELFGKHFKPNDTNAIRRAVLGKRDGDPDLTELFNLIVKPNEPSIRKAGERLKATPRKIITTTKATTKQPQQMTTAQRPQTPFMNTMRGQLSNEMRLANDPIIKQAIKDVYGFDFTPERDLIPWDSWENKQLQRAGVDFITPEGIKVDLKGRGAYNQYQDIPLELISQEYGGLNFAPHGRGANNIHTVNRRGIDDRPLDGNALSQLIQNMDSRNKIGWTIDPNKQTDQLIYSNPGIGRVSIIDAPALRERTFDLVDAQYQANREKTGFTKPFYSVWQNPTYNTINLPVSYDVLERVLGNKIRDV